MRHAPAAVLACALVLAAGCGSDPRAEAIADVRAAIPPAASGSVSDDQIVAMGRVVCAGLTGADDPSVPRDYRDAVVVLARHCEAW